MEVHQAPLDSGAINCGIASSVAALVIGRRQNFGSVAFTPHNMTMISGAMLILGWLGFCGGCALTINGYAMLVVLITLSGAVGGVMAWTL